MNPNLMQMNPNLMQMNPNLIQMNPKLPTHLKNRHQKPHPQNHLRIQLTNSKNEENVEEDEKENE